MIAPNSRAREAGRGGEYCLGGLVQPIHQYIALCLKRVEWELYSRGFRMVGRHFSFGTASQSLQPRLQRLRRRPAQSHAVDALPSGHLFVASYNTQGKVCVLYLPQTGDLVVFYVFQLCKSSQIFLSDENKLLQSKPKSNHFHSV